MLARALRSGSIWVNRSLRSEKAWESRSRGASVCRGEPEVGELSEVDGAGGGASSGRAVGRCNDEAGWLCVGGDGARGSSYDAKGGFDGEDVSRSGGFCNDCGFLSSLHHHPMATVVLCRLANCFLLSNDEDHY